MDDQMPAWPTTAPAQGSIRLRQFTLGASPNHLSDEEPPDSTVGDPGANDGDRMQPGMREVVPGMIGAMDIELADVTEANWRDVAAVKPHADQNRFVAPTTYYLCLCHYGGQWNPFAVVADGAVVGFVMWAVDTDSSRWIGGLVVDSAAQRQGVGSAVVQALLDRFAAEPACHEAALSYQPENLAARSLYASLGFVEGDEWNDDEIVARRRV
jgi:diamine N-acetyltransferase